MYLSVVTEELNVLGWCRLCTSLLTGRHGGNINRYMIVIAIDCVGIFQVQYVPGTSVYKNKKLLQCFGLKMETPVMKEMFVKFVNCFCIIKSNVQFVNWLYSSIKSKFIYISEIMFIILKL